MKKILLTLLSMASLATATYAVPMPIRFGQLPDEIQSYTKNHFPLGDDAYRNAYVTYDEEMPEAAYTIVFTVGDGLEFRSNNELKVYQCHSKGVPASILPEVVAQSVEAQYGNAKIEKYEVVRISLSACVYEITMDGGEMVTYDEEGKIYTK